MKKRKFLAIPIPLVVLSLLTISVTGYSLAKKANLLPNKNTYSFRFNTLQGGQFDVKYPTNYFASQDNTTKAVSFKLSECSQNCETLIIAEPVKDITQSGEVLKIGEHEFYKAIDKNNLILYPKFTDKLGLVKINSAVLTSQPSTDFTQIIGSLNFIKEVAVEFSPKISTAQKSGSNNMNNSTAKVSSTPSINQNKKPQTSNITPPFIKQKQIQTGPNNWEPLPQEVAAIPDSQLLGFKCKEYQETKLGYQTLVDGTVSDYIYLSDQNMLNLLDTLKVTQSNKVGRFNYCNTDNGLSFIIYSVIYRQDITASFINNEFKIGNTVSWIPSEKECLYPMAFKSQGNIFSASQVVYISCSTMGQNDPVYRVDFNKKTAKLL